MIHEQFRHVYPRTKKRVTGSKLITRSGVLMWPGNRWMDPTVEPGQSDQVQANVAGRALHTCR